MSNLSVLRFKENMAEWWLGLSEYDKDKFLEEKLKVDMEKVIEEIYIEKNHILIE